MIDYFTFILVKYYKKEVRYLRIQLNNISKSYGKSFAVENFNLDISSGDFVSFLGPSGCGKTTVLRMISGLETPDSGEIFFDDICVFSSKANINVPAEKRNLGFVFQDFALWPHLNVFENVAFSLRARKDTKNLDDRVMKALSAVKLSDFNNRYPSQLSGGQQQRVAFARAIVGNPRCILFDEPLSALDAVLRESMRTEIKQITSDLKATAVFVTHDQVEAMSMSDYIAVMNRGKIEQFGSPEEIYNKPQTTFTAEFIGKFNRLDGDMMFRPENTLFYQQENCLPFETKVVAVQFLGNSYQLTLDSNGRIWTVFSPQKHDINEKLTVFIDKTKLIQIRS